MLKYVDTKVTFSEVPDEVTLCFSISGCTNKCPGCHSKELWEDIGEYLDYETLEYHLKKNIGITCVCFLGGDCNVTCIYNLATYIKSYNSNLKVAWYSGKDELPPKKYIKLFDFIKIGPYIKDRGPLNNPNTNQKFYRVSDNKIIDETYKFWNENKSKNI